jgi:hypothetical protein
MAKFNILRAITTNPPGQMPYELSTANVATAYTPAASDRIIVNAYNPTAISSDNQNLNFWTIWDSGTSSWKIYASDSSWTGAFFCVIKTT